MDFGIYGVCKLFIPSCYSSFTQFTHTCITLNIIRIKMAISAQTTATASYKLSLANV